MCTTACSLNSKATITEQLGQSKISEFRHALNHVDGLDPELRDGLFALLATPGSAAPAPEMNMCTSSTGIANALSGPSATKSCRPLLGKPPLGPPSPQLAGPTSATSSSAKNNLEGSSGWGANAWAPVKRKMVEWRRARSAGPGAGSADGRLVPLGDAGNDSMVPPRVEERRARSAVPPGSSTLASAGATLAGVSGGASGSRGRFSGDSSGSEWAPVRKRVSEDRRTRMESLASQIPTPQRSPDLHCRPSRDGDTSSRLLQASDAGRDGARVVGKRLRPVSAPEAG